MIFAHTHIEARVVDGAPLAYDDVTGLYDLFAKLLDAEPLGMGLTAVLGTGLTFLVCHNLFLLLKLSDSVDVDLGELLTVTVERLESLATDFLEYEHLLGFGVVIYYGGLYGCTFYIRSSNLYSTLGVYQEHPRRLPGAPC